MKFIKFNMLRNEVKLCKCCEHLLIKQKQNYINVNIVNKTNFGIKFHHSLWPELLWGRSLLSANGSFFSLGPGVVCGD